MLLNALAIVGVGIILGLITAKLILMAMKDMYDRIMSKK